MILIYLFQREAWWFLFWNISEGQSIYSFELRPHRQILPFVKER